MVSIFKICLNFIGLGRIITIIGKNHHFFCLSVLQHMCPSPRREANVRSAEQEDGGTRSLVCFGVLFCPWGLLNYLPNALESR